MSARVSEAAVHDAICVRCGTGVEFIEAQPSCPDGAVLFYSGGNYGSRVWDEMHRTLLIYLCDLCLVDVGKSGWVSEVERIERPATRYVDWSPEQEEVR